MCCVCTILSRDYICMLLSFGIDCCACSVHLYKHFQTFISSMFYRYAHFGDTKTWTTECIPKNILNGWEYMFFFCSFSLSCIEKQIAMFVVSMYVCSARKSNWQYLGALFAYTKIASCLCLNSMNSVYFQRFT